MNSNLLQKFIYSAISFGISEWIKVSFLLRNTPKSIEKCYFLPANRVKEYSTEISTSITTNSSPEEARNFGIVKLWNINKNEKASEIDLKYV